MGYIVVVIDTSFLEIIGLAPRHLHTHTENKAFYMVCLYDVAMPSSLQLRYTLCQKDFVWSCLGK